MKQRIFVTVALSGILLVSLGVATRWFSNAAADTIILKDGTREESERVWESEDYVHFILKGTKTVEIRIAKEIVTRVESQAVEPNSSMGGSEGRPEGRQEGKRVQTQNADNEPQQQAAPVRASTETEAPQAGKRLDPAFVQDLKGVSFYDPRRRYRYWSGADARHSTLQEALSSLAQTYGRPAEWVQENMGEENDLGSIHAKLVQQVNQERLSMAVPTSALGALPEQALRQVDLPNPPPDETKQAIPRRLPTLESLNHRKTDPLQFYDPRREKKYWLSSTTRFDTLDEAVKALAQQYQVPVRWIEEHMGESNKLDDIHQSIRESLAPR